MAEFETSVTVNCPIEHAFEFLLRPANVALVSPPSVGLQFLKAPDIVEVGSRLEFRVQAYGQVQQFVHEVTLVDRPTRIVEQQVQGIFRKWVHEHILEESPQGTLVIDRIEFEPPAGLIGLLLTKNKILDQLDDGYFHRHKQLAKLLEGT